MCFLVTMATSPFVVVVVVVVGCPGTLLEDYLLQASSVSSIYILLPCLK